MDDKVRLIGMMDKAAKGVKLSRREIEAIKEKRFKRVVKYSFWRSSFYRKKFKEAKVDIDAIKSVNDIVKLPFTVKEELGDTHPLDISCASKEEIVRIQVGGTAERPIVIPYTRHDIEQWKEMVLRAFHVAKITSKDVIQIALVFGLWNGGFGFHSAVDAINAFVVPVNGNIRTHVRLMKDFGTTVLCATAGYPVRIAEVAEGMGIDVKDLPLDKILLVDPWSYELKKRIEKTFDATTYVVPCLAEMGGIGTVGFECPMTNGLHVWEDNYIVEVVDPETGEPVADGEKGELVYTSLNGEAMPLVRYRSGEVGEVVSREPCECGIEHMRIRRVKRRTDDMISCGDIRFYPSEIGAILSNYGVKRYRIEAENGKIRVLLEGSDDLIPNIMRDIEEFLGFTPDLELLPKGY